MALPEDVIALKYSDLEQDFAITSNSNYLQCKVTGKRFMCECLPVNYVNESYRKLMKGL